MALERSQRESGTSPALGTPAAAPARVEVGPLNALRRRLRLKIPSAYSRLDRFAVVIVGASAGMMQATGKLPNPQDAWGYWTADLSHLYPDRWGPDGTYIYPPVLAQLMALLHPIGWAVFIVVWTTLLWACLAYMLGRWTWLFVYLGLAATVLGSAAPFEMSNVLGQALNGNVQLFIAAGIVMALRGRPAGWLPAVLTKVVAGIGLGWYVLRREWKPLFAALLIGGAVAAVSFVFSPSAWFEWVAWILKHSSIDSPVLLEPIPFVVRLPACLVLLVWGARTDRAWVVPIVVGFSTPALYMGTYPSMWIAAIPLYLDARARRRAASMPEVVPAAA